MNFRKKDAETLLIPFVPANEETQSDEESQEQVEATQKSEELSSRETKKTATADTVEKPAEKEAVAEKTKENSIKTKGKHPFSELDTGVQGMKEGVFL